MADTPLRDWYNILWWQQHAINLGDAGHAQYFVIELLDSQFDQQQKQTTDYYQITALAWQKTNAQFTNHATHRQ